MSGTAPTARARPLLGARKITLTLLFAAAIVAGGGVGVFLAYESDLPQISSLEDYRPNIITQVFAHDGTLLGQFAIERRVPVTFKDIPPVLRNAVVAVEDEDFWKHMGINPWSIPRAALANLRSGRRSEGFSTLTMQISRLLFLTPEKTYERKIKEIILAFQIEKNFTKEEIFTLYCNQIYFGHGNYGVEAASQFFFSKPLAALTLDEAALLAGIPQSPARLSPIEHPDQARQRRDHVIQRMLEEKYVTAEEAREARARAIQLQIRRDPPSIAPHFLEEVRKYLEREYGSQRIYQGGLTVHTTLDVSMQRAAMQAMTEGLRSLDRQVRGFVRPTDNAAEHGSTASEITLPDWDRRFAAGDVVRGVVQSVDRQLAVVRLGDLLASVGPAEIAWTKHRRPDQVLSVGDIVPLRLLAIDAAQHRARAALEQEPDVEGALVALDVRSGAVRAMVGGYDFQRSKFNRATQALRQAGSVFKPVVYTAAIEKAGWSAATLVSDTPLSIPDPWDGTVWSPQDYDGSYLGTITVRRALEKSRNIPAIRTLQRVGVPTGIEYAHRLGITNELPPYLPIAIGAGETTLIDMTTVFATFANQGLRMRPYLVERVTDRDGNVIEETHPQATDAIGADTAYVINSLLRGVVERGTAVRAKKLNRPIAGKTGTTNDWTDGWFIGYEPTLAAGVWVGFDDKRRSLGRHHDGARTALPIWMEFWKQVMTDKPVEEYRVPGNIVFVPVDEMGRPTRAGTPGARMEVFIAGGGGSPRP